MRQYLAQTLKSIEQVDYHPLEVVIVDDGSTDDSAAIAQHFVDSHPDSWRLIKKANGGVSSARNAGIAAARGEYILPFDSDDIIRPQMVTQSVKAMEADPTIKAVATQAEYFEGRTGLWHLPEFDIRLLARKNFIFICALFRKADWERVGGYCEELKAREDWDFWISVLKDGGRFVRLDEVGFLYRIRQNSKRISDRRLKRHVVETLNSRHPEFFERYLHGPLRLHRSWSKTINLTTRIFSPIRTVVSSAFTHLRWQIKAIPRRFDYDYGTVIHDRRNQLREMTIDSTTLIVKRFAHPNIINGIVYGTLRQSKARRSYRYATELNAIGIASPTPVAYIQHRRLGLLRDSYYVSVKSVCRYTFYDVIDNDQLPHRAEYLAETGRMTALLHEAGYYPLDYSGGNILLDFLDGKVLYQLVDLNRMRRGAVGIDLGCRGFERLNVEPAALDIMATAYAAARGFDPEQCKCLIRQYRWKKHQK